MSKLAENTVKTNTEITEADIEKQRLQQEKEYLGPREMAAYIISGFGDKNWETFSGNNMFFYKSLIDLYYLFTHWLGLVVPFDKSDQFESC